MGGKIMYFWHNVKYHQPPWNDTTGVRLLLRQILTKIMLTLPGTITNQVF